METIKLDISKTGIAVSAEMQAKAQAANALLESGKGAGERPRSSSASASGVRTWAPRPCSKP